MQKLFEGVLKNASLRIAYQLDRLGNSKREGRAGEICSREASSGGGKIHSIFLTMGEYDLVTISEMPNDEAYATLMLALGGQGNIRTKTLKAFTEDEFGSIVANLPG